MRVFDCYAYSIADKVKSKDTKEYVDGMLAELGLGYTEVGFGMNCGDIDKVLEKYPSLEKYCCLEDENDTSEGRLYFNRLLTSYSKEWKDGKIYADKEDWDTIFELFTKIPRPFRFGTSNMILSGIDWYGNCDLSTAIEAKEYNRPLVLPRYFTSNRIELDRGVSVTIEATDEPVPKDTSDIARRLTPYLGTPIRFCRSCMFSETELKRRRELEQKYKERLVSLFKTMFDFDYDYHSKEHGPFDSETIPKIADKRKITKAFKGTGFEIGSRSDLLPGMTRVIHTDSHNYRYEILFDRGPSAGNSFSLNIHITGFNFRLYFGQERFGVKSEQEAEDRLKRIAEYCVCIRNQVCEEMADEFGDTPDWYWVSYQ